MKPTNKHEWTRMDLLGICRIIGTKWNNLAQRSQGILPCSLRSLGVNKKWLATAFLVFSFSSFAEVSNLMNYQGRLQDDLGLPMDGNLPMSISVYDQDVNGTQLYFQDMGSVPVQNGVFSFNFGDETILTVLTNAQCCTEVVVDGNIMVPRQRLVAVPYAFQARTVQGDHIRVSSAALILSPDPDEKEGAQIVWGGGTNDGVTAYVDWNTDVYRETFRIFVGRHSLNQQPRVDIFNASSSGLEAGLYVQGKAGIGMHDPGSGYQFGVDGKIKSTDGMVLVGPLGGDQVLELRADDAVSKIVWHDPDQAHYMMGIDPEDGHKFKFGYGASSFSEYEGITITHGNSCQMGVGTADPQSRLHVNGGDIRVSGGSFIDDGATLNVPDYVFEDGYLLMNLDELAAYIEKEKHLPNMPSRDEVKADGLNMSEFQMRLLEKIEELTLHIIKQQQEIERQHEEIELLKSNVEE